MRPGHEIAGRRDQMAGRVPQARMGEAPTCGKCHGPVEREFQQSIHGQAIARGDWQAPICTDCHGIHMIKPHVDPTSSVAAAPGEAILSSIPLASPDYPIPIGVLILVATRG